MTERKGATSVSSSSPKWRAAGIAPTCANNATQRNRTIQTSLAVACAVSPEIGGAKNERISSSKFGSLRIRASPARLSRLAGDGRSVLRGPVGAC